RTIQPSNACLKLSVYSTDGWHYFCGVSGGCPLFRHSLIIDLLWRPVEKVVRFVLVVHPTRERCILMTTDLSLVGIDVIYLYGLRFKIEHAFKQTVRVIGGFSYHFWMKAMKPLHRCQGDQYLHRETEKYRQQVARKIKAYHLFVHVGIVSQGLLHYLAASFPDLVWE
ncbi:MAG: hypothetical protein ABW168_03075, partial [Sedimenticola sp.]